MTLPPYFDAARSAPVFVAGVNVFTEPVRFENYTDAPGARAGMGNLGWFEEVDPFHDPDSDYDPKDFIGFWADIQQPLSQTLARGGQNEATQQGSLYGPRPYATIIKPDWRFSWDDVYYHTVGVADFNHRHPLTGEDFGYVRWTVRKGG